MNYIREASCYTVATLDTKGANLDAAKFTKKCIMHNLTTQPGCPIDNYFGEGLTDENIGYWVDVTDEVTAANLDAYGKQYTSAYVITPKSTAAPVKQDWYIIIDANGIAHMGWEGFMHRFVNV